MVSNHFLLASVTRPLPLVPPTSPSLSGVEVVTERGRPLFLTELLLVPFLFHFLASPIFGSRLSSSPASHKEDKQVLMLSFGSFKKEIDDFSYAMKSERSFIWRSSDMISGGLGFWGNLFFCKTCIRSLLKKFKRVCCQDWHSGKNRLLSPFVALFVFCFSFTVQKFICWTRVRHQFKIFVWSKPILIIYSIKKIYLFFFTM